MDNPESIASSRMNVLDTTTPPPIPWCIAGVVVLYYICDLIITKRITPDPKLHPIVGKASWWAPRTVLNFIFTFKALSLINEGYQKVCKETRVFYFP